MNIKKIILTCFSLIGMFFIITSSPIQNIFWVTYSFLDPHLEEKTEQAWKDNPNQYLLNKLHSNNYLYPGVAADILLKRKDKSLVPTFIKLLKSRDSKMIGTAIEILGKTGDTRAIPYLMEFVNDGSKDVHYRMALEALSELKYEPIIPSVIELANTNLGNDLRPQDYALRMMRNLQSKEFIEVLKKMKEIGPVPSIREDAAEILRKIEQRQINSGVSQKSGK